MTTKLQSCFPMIRTRMEVMEEIRSKPALSGTFKKWKEGQQKEQKVYAYLLRIILKKVFQKKKQ